MFVEEALRFIPSLEHQPLFELMFTSNARDIQASLLIFTGKRYIDAGKPRQAPAYFQQAYTIQPAAVRKVWYKVVQAVGDAIGLSGLFLGYRQLRRSVRHCSRPLIGNANGPHWQTK